MKSVIIIGAGYAGIALANLLSAAGYRVTIYEKNEAPGGRIYVKEQDGFTFDLGPSWYLIPEAFSDYYALFGKSATKRLELQRLTPGFTVFYEHHKPITIQGNLQKDAATFEAVEPGAGAALTRYVAKSRTVYQIALQDFLYSNFEHPVKLMLTKGQPLLKMAFMSLDSHVSRHIKTLRLKQILEYQAVFLGNSPFELPALYSLMSTLDFESGVFYPKRGMYSLVTDLMQLVPSGSIAYHYNTPVRRINTTGGAATGITLHDGTEVLADIIVSNADLQFTETQLLQPHAQSYPRRYWDKKQPGPGGLVIALGVTGALPQLTHHSLLFVDAWRENFDAIYTHKKMPENASIYICNPSKTDPRLAPKGHENLFILVPIPAGITLTANQQTSFVAHYIQQCARMAAIPDLQERIVTQTVFGPADFEDRYHAWQANAFGGQSHLLSQSVFFRARNKSKRLDNLYYVGAGTTPGIGLPMCLISAQQTYKKIVGITTDGPLRPEDIAPRESTLSTPATTG